MHIRKRSLRFSVIFLFIIFLLLFFTGKLIYIQFFRSDYLAKLAARQHNDTVTLEPIRGTIYDREMRPLAINVAVYSLYANPRRMSEKDKAKAYKFLPEILKEDPATLRQQLERDKYFVWLDRKMPIPTMEKIKKLNISGLGFIRESKRYYPNQYLAAHIIGFAGMDNKGLEGIEMSFDQYLRGEPGWTQVLRDARARELLIEKNSVPPKDGFSLVLTIDETIQFIAEKALQKGMETHNAKAATIIVMNPRTGEILALANRPTYDLAQFDRSPSENRTNRAIAYVYEPGSVFKIVVATGALEENAFKETDKIFCENGAYRVGNHILHDAHPKGTLTFQQVIEESSNIGTTKIAQKIGPDKFYKYAHLFRFGIKTGIDLHGEVDGWLKPPSQWSATSIGALPIGQEVTVTPLQLVGAIGAIANDGVYMKPFVVKYIKDNHDELIKAFQPQVLDRVMSVETNKRVKEILVGVVENGTGKKAQIPGVRVGGKTGTAQKVVGNSYVSKYYSSFIGFAPVDDPKVAVVVVYDEPHPAYYGGTVAAPVFQEVVSDTLKYLQAKEGGI